MSILRQLEALSLELNEADQEEPIDDIAVCVDGRPCLYVLFQSDPSVKYHSPVEAGFSRHLGSGTAQEDASRGDATLGTAKRFRGFDKRLKRLC